MNNEGRAAELLARASREMDNCQKNMQEALGYSRYGACNHTPRNCYKLDTDISLDMWGGGTYALFPGDHTEITVANFFSAWLICWRETHSPVLKHLHLK